MASPNQHRRPIRKTAGIKFGLALAAVGASVGGWAAFAQSDSTNAHIATTSDTAAAAQDLTSATTAATPTSAAATAPETVAAPATDNSIDNAAAPSSMSRQPITRSFSSR